MNVVIALRRWGYVEDKTDWYFQAVPTHAIFCRGDQIYLAVLPQNRFER
jgi:hypothetical protein